MSIGPEPKPIQTGATLHTVCITNGPLHTCKLFARVYVGKSDQDINTHNEHNGLPLQFNAYNTGKYYKIRYKDNDEEELNHSEVRKHANKNSGEGRTISEVGQRLRLRIPLGDWNILANESERL
jgi:hypothetical protein